VAKNGSHMAQPKTPSDRSIMGLASRMTLRKVTLLGINISHQKYSKITFESMIFLFPRWDMFVFLEGKYSHNGTIITE